MHRDGLSYFKLSLIAFLVTESTEAFVVDFVESEQHNNLYFPPLPFKVF